MKYSRSNFNHDIALQDSSPMYQINEPNEIFLKFIDICENLLSCHAPLKLVESSTKITKAMVEKRITWSHKRKTPSL